MAGKSPAPSNSRIPSATGTPPNKKEEPINEGNIEDIESQTIDKVNKTITVLEGSLATWDAAKEKPKEMTQRFEKYRSLHDQLTEWETKILRSRMKQENLSFDKRLARLREFIEICYANA